MLDGSPKSTQTGPCFRLIGSVFPCTRVASYTVGPLELPERTQSQQLPRAAVTNAWLGSDAATWCGGGFVCFFFVVVWCEDVVVPDDVVGGAPRLPSEESLSCHAAKAAMPATIRTMMPTAASGLRNPTPAKGPFERANRSGTSCGSSGWAKRLLYSST